MDHNDGGPAFPRSSTINPPGEDIEMYANAEQDGMTLRDYFAAATMTGFASQEDGRSPQTPGEKENIEAWRQKIFKQDAEYCYAMADAMIAARDK